MNEISLILGMFLVTFGVRYTVLALISKFQLPKIVLRGLNFVPPTVLTAIIIPSILIRDQYISLKLSNAPLYASVISCLVAWKTKNLLYTILIGMVTLWFWRWIF